MLSSPLDEVILLVFRDREIQGSLNGLCVRLGVQSSLGALDPGRGPTESVCGIAWLPSS